MILMVLSLSGFSFVSPVSAVQEPLLISISPKTAWEKLTSNWHNFSFTSSTLAPAVNKKSENDLEKIDFGLARFFTGLNSRFNEFNKFTDELIYSLSDSTYSAFSKAAESAKNLNLELAISQLSTSNVSGVKSLELGKVFSNQLKAVEALNPIPAVRNFLATANRNLNTALVSTPTPISSPTSTPTPTPASTPTPTLTPTPPTGVGVEFTVNSSGLQSLSYNGQNFATGGNYNHIVNNATFISPGGTEKPYGWIDGKLGDTAVPKPQDRSTGTNPDYFQHIYRQGLDDSFTLKMVWTAPDSRTAKVDIYVTNNDPTDTLSKFSLEYWLGGAGGKYFTTPNMAAYNSLWFIVSQSSPVAFVKGNSWGSVAFFTDNYNNHSKFYDVWTNSFTTGTGTDNPVNFLFILQNYDSPGGAAGNLKINPIPPGGTWHYALYIRFGSSEDTAGTLAPEAFDSYRQSYPYLVNWPDRRPIARFFIAEGTKRSATNPRGYFNDPTLDVSKQTAFNAKVLSWTDSAINRMNAMDPKPQGIMIWDLEGQEFRHAFTYIGYPNKLPEIAPEMDAVADEMFAKFRNAGYQIGMTLRPMKFGTGNTLPATCHNDAKYGLTDKFIKLDATFPYRSYLCSAPDTWTVGGGAGLGDQVVSDNDQEILELMRSKVSYAKNRWGAKIFYVDSTVYSNGGAFNFEIFRQLQKDFPDVVFFPENENLGFYGASAPYNQTNMGAYDTSSSAKQMYPQAFSMLQATDGVNYADPAAYNKMVQSVKNGNILYVDGWYASTQNTNILKVYRDAGISNATYSPPTPTPFPSPDAIPPVISSVAASSITQTSATIIWTTDESSNTQVEYGTTTAYGTSTTLNTSLVTTHSALLSGLSPVTLYHYRVKSKDAAGNLATSNDFTFTTSIPPPQISGVQAGNITDTSATIIWTTDKPTTSKVNYGLTSSYTTSTVKNNTLVTSHSVSLGGLSPSTPYHYQVESTASGNLTSVSADQTFTTTATPTLPAISNIQSTNTTFSSATITWATDKPSDSQVEYGSTTAYGASTTLNTSLVTAHSVLLSGLSTGTTYNFRVKSGGSVSINQTFYTPALPDTTFPSVVVNLSVASTTKTSINLSWIAPGDDGSIGTASSYEMRWQIVPITAANWSNGIILTGLPTPLVAGTTQTYTAIGLSPNTTYYFALKTKDEASNESAISNIASGKIKKYPSGSIKNLTASASDKLVQLNWSAPSNADSDVKYAVLRNTTGGLSTYVLTLNETKVQDNDSIYLTDSNLTNDTTYYYSIFAYYDLGDYSSGVFVPAKPQAAVTTNTSASGGGGGGGVYIPDVTPAGQVKVTRAAEADSQILLEWTNPTDADFARVLIVRKEGGEPASRNDGYTALEGNVSTYDVTNLKNGITYYFAIYTMDLAKNYSIPVIVKGTPKAGVTSFTEKLAPTNIIPTTSYVAPILPVPSAVAGKFVSPYPSGALIRYLLDKDVYLIENNTKRLISDPKTLAALTNNNPGKVIITPYKETIAFYATDSSVTSKDLAKAKTKLKPFLLKTKDNPTIYLIDSQAKTKKPIPSLPVFYSYGFSFGNVLVVPKKELAGYTDGGTLAFQSLADSSLVKSPVSPKIYVIQNGQKRWVKTYDTFKAYKFDLKNVIIQPKEVLDQYQNGVNLDKTGETITGQTTQIVPTPTPVPIPVYKDGTLLKSSGPTVYYIENNAKRAFGSLAVFELLGYKMSSVKTVNDKDLGLLATGDPISSVSSHPNGTLVRLAGDPKVYLIEGGKLRWIVSLEAFKAKGYALEQVISVSQTEFDEYMKGEEIR